MLQFFRVNNHVFGRDEFLEVVDACWVKGSEIPGTDAEFYDRWFELKISEQNRMYVSGVIPNTEFAAAAAIVELFVNDAQNMKTLPTKYNFHINVSGERIIHSDNVYIAETEQEVWDYLNAL